MEKHYRRLAKQLAILGCYNLDDCETGSDLLYRTWVYRRHELSDAIPASQFQGWLWRSLLIFRESCLLKAESVHMRWKKRKYWGYLLLMPECVFRSFQRSIKMLFSWVGTGKQHIVYFRQSGVGTGEDANGRVIHLKPEVWHVVVTPVDGFGTPGEKIND